MYRCVFIHVYVCICMYVCVCMYVYVYMCMHVCISKHKNAYVDATPSNKNDFKINDEENICEKINHKSE